MDSRIRDFFTEQYEHNWYLRSRADILSTIIRPICTTSASLVVDVGAGSGSVLARVAADAAVGIEGAWELARIGRLRHGLRFLVADIGKGIPIADGTADVVLALDVLEHLDDDHGAAAEAFRILRRSGTLVVSVPAFQSLWSRHDELHHHKRRYSKRMLLDMLASAGFTCTRVTYFNTLLLPLVYVSRKIERFVPSSRDGATDYEKAPRFLAGTLGAVFGFEKRILACCNLPVGVSLLALARRA